MPQPVLIVEDDELQSQMLTTLLRRKLDFGAQHARNGRQALDILEADQGHTIKIIILDLEMPVMGGMETLEILRQTYPGIPVIMLTGSKDIDRAVQAMKLGAIDFLTKPYEAERMAVTVKNALKLSTLSKEVSRLKREQDGTFTFANLVGHDRGLLAVVTPGRKAAASDIPVLITGETGTGKEVFAKAIHGESRRAGRPFVAVNCGAIPSQLVESTLFGHEKGAFTGATEKVIGKFREAEGGTVFLDEIGELPLDTQVKLLRVLQQKEVEPVGAGRPVRVDVRIISATNRDVHAEVQAGRFREDLFFRLNVLQIELPALRARRPDIPALVDHFIERYCANEGALPKTLSPQAEQALGAYAWPGNVRQLENTINRAMVLSEGPVLDLADFAALFSPAALDAGLPDHGGGAAGASGTGAGVGAGIEAGAAIGAHIQLAGGDGRFKTLEEIEYEAMQAALTRSGDNITQAAKMIGMAKSTFYKKLKHHR